MNTSAEGLVEEPFEQLGERWETENGGINWSVNDYSTVANGQTVYFSAYFGEIDGYVFAVLVAAETSEEIINGMLLDVINTIRPVE